MENLKKIEFGEIAELRKEKFNPITSNESKPCLELEHFQQESGKISGWLSSSEQKSIKNVFYKGDILFGKLRPYLRKYWLAEFDGVCSSEVWVLKPKSNEITNEYLFNIVQTNDFIQAANVSSGSKMPRADWNYIINYPFSIINSKNEQRAIAQVLSLMDTAINKNNQLIAQKELRKKWLMQNLLTGKKRLNLDSFDFYDDHDLSKNEKSSKSLNHKNHSSDNGQRLKGFGGKWGEYKLKHFIVDYNEKPKPENSYEVLTSAKTGLMKQTDYYGNNRITNRKDADYNVIPPDYITYRYRSDDGLFTFNKNTLGITGLISGYYPVFTVKNGNIDFLLMYCNHYRQKLTKYSIGTSQLVLSMNALKTAKFILPSIEEQTAIAQVLQAADKEIELLKTKTEKLREQKKGMMQVLLTGKKRLNCDSFDFSDDLDSDNQTKNHISFKSHESHKS